MKLLYAKGYGDVKRGYFIVACVVRVVADAVKF